MDCEGVLRGYVSEYGACWDGGTVVAKWYVEDYDVAWRREELYTTIKGYLLKD